LKRSAAANTSRGGGRSALTTSSVVSAFACELAVKAGVIPPPNKCDDGLYQYGRAGLASTAFLPDCVRQWLGVTTEHGGLPLGHGSLADKNDQGSRSKRSRT
jgi:hypothetical protein